MKISVLLRTSEGRGDHDADVARAYDVPEHLTIGDLVRRLLPPSLNPYRTDSDWIELRVAQRLPLPEPPKEGG